MKSKESYFYRKTLRSKMTEWSEISMAILSGKHRRVVDALRYEVFAAVANGVENRVGGELELPRVHWSVGDEGYNGIVVLTLPFGDNLELLASLRSTVNGMQQVACSFVGSSGRSLKVLMPYTLPDGSLPTGDEDVAVFHAKAHQMASAFVMQITGVKALEKDADWQRGSAVSVDELLYLNETATPVPLAMPEGMPKKLAKLESDDIYKQDLLPDYNSVEMAVTKFNMLCRRMRLRGDEPLAEDALSLARECRKMGIPEEIAVKCTLSLGNQYEKELLIRTSFENAYAEGAMGSGKVLPKALMQQQLLLHFLKKRYRFRRNIITDSMEYAEISKYGASWMPLTQTVQNTICLAAQMAGIEVWDKDLQRYLQSELVGDYDPIAEWLYALPRWDGVDRVAQLASTVKTDNPMWEHDFRLWMRSMVSQWMNRGGLYGASMALMLVGKQGTRKSTFCKRLMPDAMLTYYTDRIDFVNKREAERALIRFALICIDEFDQISKSQTAYLKHVLQKSDIKYRKMYQDDIEQRRRYAAFCATTNSPTPLIDPTGSRRYLCVEVLDEIDTSHDIDYQQLYAQIVREIRNGEKTYFSADDEKRIQEHNTRFYQEQPIEVFVASMFAKPEEGEAGEWMTALDVAKSLHSAVSAVRCDASTVRNIGKILSFNAFARKRSSEGHLYWVKKLQN